MFNINIIQVHSRLVCYQNNCLLYYYNTFVTSCLHRRVFIIEFYRNYSFLILYSGTLKYSEAFRNIETRKVFFLCLLPANDFSSPNRWFPFRIVTINIVLYCIMYSQRPSESRQKHLPVYNWHNIIINYCTPTSFNYWSFNYWLPFQYTICIDSLSSPNQNLLGFFHEPQNIPSIL